MKINIDIVLGFIEAGKTNFINSILKSGEFQNETIIILQDEFGSSEIDISSLNSQDNNKIIVINPKITEEINTFFINTIIDQYSPNRILIETNGMKDSSSIINIFKDKFLKKICRVDDIIAIIDAKKFFIYLKNMKSIVTPHILNSETIILNNLNYLNKEEFSNIQNEIKKINETAKLIEHVSTLNIKEIHQEEYVQLNNKNNFLTFKFLISTTVFIFLFTFFMTLMMSDYNIYNDYISKFKNFYTIFISILIQGLPFILVGSFISAVIQIYISPDTFIKIFPKNIFLSCIIAAFSGILFPICDCGTIPIVKGLIKKKVPIAAAITFMLAAPIVNPIGILSTIYAFQGMKSVVICRISAGIVISILVGLIMQFSMKKEDDILIINDDEINCNCGFCSSDYDSSSDAFKRLKAVFIHTGDEFFNTGKFMIIGTFLSSIFQTAISMNNNMYLPNDNKSSLITMILLSFLLSVCSTSDAFVAKGFLKLFSINSVMGFLVVGPMLDIKNTIMLFGNFNKKFVIKLIFFILVISFGVLVNLKLS
ncbi:permease [Clostridium chromiireducens]|uniref:permease n=1 Tax=Clostridium chromiireducens TaxID=225345 RepID=UPI003AF738F1